MNIYSIPPLVVSILFLCGGIFLFTRNKTSVLNITFALEWVCVAIWLFGYSIVYNTTDANIALLWCKIVYIGPAFIPTFFYHFTLAILQIPKKKIYIVLNYSLGFLFLGFLFFTTDFVSGVYRYFWGYQTRVGFLHNFYLVWFIVIFLHCCFKIYKFTKIKKGQSPIEYNRLKYVLIAYIIASFGLLDVIPNYGIEFYPFFGFSFVGIGLVLVSYAIVRYRLMDVNIALTRAGIFAFVYILVLGIPFGIGALVKESLSNITPHWWLVPMFLLVVLASLGPFIYLRIQKKIEARLRAEEFKSHGALRRLSRNMLRFSNLEDLLKLIVHHLVKILKLKFAAIYLLDGRSDRYILNTVWHKEEAMNLPKSVSRDSALVKDFSLRHLPIVTEELRLYAPKNGSGHTKSLINILSGLNANTVIPSFLRNDLLGFLVLSDRRTKAAFTQEDINLLMVLSNEAALAIENAQFHEKEKLMLVEKSRREALADMAPGASHQFNNRLVAISSSAELLLLKLESIDVDRVQDENAKKVLNDAKHTLQIIDKEVYKGKEITSAILRRAKAKVDFQNLDIVNLIEGVYQLIQISHSRADREKFREPKFKLTKVNEIPNIYASEALLQDCFYNLLDNAYDAIHEKARSILQGELNIDKETDYHGAIEIILERASSILIIQVKDNGIGLTKENKRKIFTPYFTTKASSGKGSGLGLYVIRDFVEMHRGSIVCDSEYGVGTTFTIRLSIKGGKYAENINSR